MTTIKSLEDLKRLREQALQKRDVKRAEGTAQVIVGMGTCGIAAGARETMKAVLETIEQDGLTGILVTQTGCIGLCEKEPIMQVVIGDAKVVYGKVSADVARQIMKEHVVGGKVVENHVIPM